MQRRRSSRRLGWRRAHAGMASRAPARTRPCSKAPVCQRGREW
jgi:hypothetical protein